MTEQQWLRGTDIHDLTAHAEGKATGRKLRLFAASCCRSGWHLLAGHPMGREAVEMAERLADGLATSADLAASSSGMRQAWGSMGDADREPPTPAGLSPGEGEEARALLSMAAHKAHEAVWYATEAGSGAGQQFTGAAHAADAMAAALLLAAQAGIGSGQRVREKAEVTARIAAGTAGAFRDIVGNPFRPAVFDLAWLTPTVVGLATAVYEGRLLPSGEQDLDRLAVLSDALEEAGCDDADILGHLRSPGPHVRGCRALDILLGQG